MSNQIDDVKAIIVDILKKHDVTHASLFGSIVRGKRSEDSDIDLLIQFEGKKSLLDLSRLKLELQEVLQCEVDLLTYNSINPLLKEQILNEQVEIL